MKRVFICSPLAPRDGRSLEDNMRLAELLCLAASNAGVSPYAPHLVFTRFFDDNSPEARERGIASGEAWLDAADELWLFARNESECSTGMLRELKRFQGRDLALLNSPHRVVWMPPCFEAIAADIPKALRDGPRTLMWEVRRAEELRRQAENMTSTLIGKFFSEGRIDVVDREALETEFLMKG